jgi:hypothetical protein
MGGISKEWTTERLEILRTISKNYSIQEKEKIRLEYLENLIARLPAMEINKNDILINELVAVIDSLPHDFEELIYGSYLTKFNSLEYLIRKRFNLIPHRNHRINLIDPFSFESIIGYIFTGIIIYFSFLLFEKPIFVLAIGGPLGIVVSKLVRIYLDKKAKRENRII